MVLLVGSLLLLVAGPVLVARVRNVRPAAVSIDAFVVVTISGLVLIHILPESLTHGGWVALLATIVGLYGPFLAERGLRTGATDARPASGPSRTGERIVLLLALLGLAAHAALDGLALGHNHAASAHADHGHDHGHDHSSSLIAWAVLLHRLPVGISIWWLIPRTLGVKIAVGTLVLIGGATVGGFFLGSAATDSPVSQSGLAIFQALLAGSLLHVVLHSHLPPPKAGRTPKWEPASTLGAILAVAALAAVTVTHPSEVIAEAGEVFVGIALASAPALLIAYLAVGFVHELLPSGRLSWLRDRGPLAQAAGGVLCGLPLPVCSCGIVPLYRELVLKGAPVAAALAFLVATPELEVAAFLLTYELMGAPMAVARVGAAAAIALFVGWIVGRRARPPADAVTGDEVAPAASRRPGVIGRALRFGLTEAVDHTAAWILLGLGVAALLSPYLSPDWAAGLWPGADVLVAALLGLPLYVCASGSTPVAAILVLNGMSPGAALAFLLTGPATNVTTFGLLSRLHGRGTALRFGISMIVLSVGAGLLVNAFLPALDLADPTRHVHDPSWVSIVSLGLLGLAFFASFLRQGTRRFIERVALAPTLGAHDAPDHDPGADDHDGSPRPCCGPERDAVT